MGKYLAIFSVVAFVIFALFASLYFAYGRRYSRKEFSPDDFSVRYFTYRYEPITETVLSGRTCLLYTSPSPRDQRGSRMPSSA